MIHHKRPRTLFIGSVEFSRTCLRELVRRRSNLVAVLSVSPRQARFNSDFVDLEPFARAHRIPFYRIGRVSDPETVDLIRSLDPDLIFVFGFSQLIPSEVLQIPRLGNIGTHPSLLPRDRGRHPLIWALVDGQTECGLTFFFLDKGADSGDILWQQRFPIEKEDDAGSLYEKISTLAVEAITEFLPGLEAGEAPRVAQDPSKATVRRKRGAEDGVIDWNTPAENCHNLVRALTRPYVAATAHIDGIEVRVWKSRIENDPGSLPDLREGSPGQILKIQGNQLAVKTADGVLWLTEWESAGDPQIQLGAIFGPSGMESS